MARRDEIVAFASEYLEVGSYPDHCPVGLQVTGSDEVARIACSVSSSRELFERAARGGAHLVLVHHGLFWDRDPRVVDPPMRDRLQALFAADLSLVAYHLALDAHHEIGNNALLLQALGVSETSCYGEVARVGELDDACSVGELSHRVQTAVGRKPLVFADGPDAISRVAVCTGSAASLFPRVIADGYDCFITGEPSEPTMMIAREAGVHFIAAGHYATETFGVKALAEVLAGEFGLSWEFVDLPNPV
ncbi:MAG: Nif3-like dinuclear metal center hexameric protein [Gaiellales bacterium]